MSNHSERAHVFFELKRYREAADQYQQALSETPDSAVAHVNFAAALFNCDDVQGAEQALRTAISLDPNLAHSYCVLSHVEHSKNNFYAAKNAILEAIRLQPTAKYFFRLAQVYAWQENRPAVLQATASALELDPTHGPTIHLRGQTLQQMGLRAEASQLFLLALQEDPQDAEAQQALGKIQLSSGDAATALPLLTEARRLDPLNTNDRLAIAEAYGLNLAPFRALNRYVIRWTLWLFAYKWALALFLSLLLCFATEISNVSSYRGSIAMQNGIVWSVRIFLVALANYFLLPHTLAICARASALTLAKRDLDATWLDFASQPAYLLWVLLLHVLATLAGATLAAMPEIAALLVALSTCSPLLVSCTRISLKRRLSFLILPLLIFEAVLGTLAICGIAYAGNWMCFMLLFVFFGISFWNEKFVGAVDVGYFASPN